MISFGSILLIALIVLVVMGPSKLPKLGHSLGQSMRDFRKAISGSSDVDVTDTVKKE